MTCQDTYWSFEECPDALEATSDLVAFPKHVFNMPVELLLLLNDPLFNVFWYRCWREGNGRLSRVERERWTRSTKLE